MTWLIVCRAVQGLGAKGVNRLAIIIISDIVPLKEYVSIQASFETNMLCSRGPYGGCIGAISGVAAYELCFSCAYYQRHTFFPVL